MKRVELLAPAGSWNCMVAAANAGCDAVYMGGSRFGARAFAENAGQEDMLRAIDWMHVRGKKLYMTVNTLLKDDEIGKELEAFLKPLYLHGLDAVIVQDVGVIRFLSERMPELPLHLSTQMTLNTAEAVATVQKLAGVSARITRFVPSRELSLNEIRILRESTSLEIETFIHGALCYSYSGQCLMSSLIGGRSGNRGRCAQPCRLQYRYQSNAGSKPSEERCLLSPKDMCTLGLLPQMIEAGIDSFKIEGRMKHEEYVAGVTEGYRKCIDLYNDLGKEQYIRFQNENPSFLPDLQKRLSELYNRGGFSHGYYDCAGGKEMMSFDRSNHNGIPVGTIESVRGINAGIRLSEKIQAQDILEIRNSNSAVYEFTVGTGAENGELYYTNFKPGSRVEPGCEVFRTRNQVLLHELNSAYVQKNRSIPVSGRFVMKTGVPITLTVQTEKVSIRVEGESAQAAKNQPMTDEKLREKLLKTNETPFYFTLLEIENDGESFCPVGKLNELRRNALERLEQTIAEQYRRNESDCLNCQTDSVEIVSAVRSDKKEPGTNGDIESKEEIRLQVLVTTQEQFKMVLSMPEPDDVYLDITDLAPDLLPELIKQIKNTDKQCFLAFPRILRKEGIDKLTLWSKNPTLMDLDGVLLRNLDVYPLLTTILKEDLTNGICKNLFITDYNLYTMNKFAKKFWQTGFGRMTCPLELNGTELSELLLSDMILPVYGRIPLMVTAQCPNRLMNACRKGTQQGDGKSSNVMNVPCLIDRLKKELPVIAHCGFCYATIHNSNVYSLAGNMREIAEKHPYAVRLDLTNETAEETAGIIRSFYDELRFGIMPDRSFLFGQTKGNYQRGTE